MVLCRTCAARLQASWRTGRSACSKDIVNSLVGSGPIRDSHVDDNDRKQQKLVHKNPFRQLSIRSETDLLYGSMSNSCANDIPIGRTWDSLGQVVESVE